MTIRIERHTQKGNDYAHYPGQILIDVPYERELLESGAAVPMMAEPENASIKPAETRKRK